MPKYIDDYGDRYYLDVERENTTTNTESCTDDRTKIITD